MRALFWIPFLCLAARAEPAKVQLLSSVPSPQPVGSSIGLLTRIDNPSKGMYVFRYSVSVNGEAFHVMRDFSQAAAAVWTPPLFELDARIHLTARNNDTRETLDAELPFHIVSRIKNSESVVSHTAHPLVALFSAPACLDGSQFRVSFMPDGGRAPAHTALQPCHAGLSSNAWVAGMRADTAYQMRAEVVRGSEVKAGAWKIFHTGMLDGNFMPVSVPLASAARDPLSEPVLVHSVAAASGALRPFATDLDGNIVWYLKDTAFLTRVLPGGRFLGLGEGINSSNDIRRLQVLREFDLAGNVLRETNASRVAEQLESRGIKSNCKKGAEECVPGFHHEAIRLPNGHTLVLAGIERMFPAGTQGSKERVDILGDLIVDLDEDFQVAWIWNSFDHMDLKRASRGDAKCKIGPGSGGCTAVFLADTANGWLHSNSLNYVPSDGSVLISMPEQNWVLKVDYQNGKGSGKVIWRLGDEGDFTAKSTDPEPWFSFQHDAGFDPPGTNFLSILDDGHERKKKHPEANSRGQVWKLDEKSKTAELVYNADLGVYSSAVGSAQKLASGGYSFEAGYINPGVSPFARAVETSADGKVVYVQQVDGLYDYRTFRVADLYSAPVK